MSKLDEVLQVTFTDCDVSDKPITVREWLEALLRTLWDQQESFSGKRPFGNSGWEYDLYKALAKAGLIKAVFDEDGELEDFDEGEAHLLVDSCIKHVFKAQND